MKYTYVGLDISKATIDVCIQKNGQYRNFKISNDAAGHQELIEKLEYHNNIYVCCEYTGIYYLEVANALYKAGIKISVVNAYSIKSHARLMLSRIKTDKQDAKLIADYCRVHQPPTWNPPSQQAQALKSLTRRIEQLTKLRTMELNRKKVADKHTEESIQSTIDYLTVEIGKIRADIEAIIAQSEELSIQQKLLMTIPGIGQTTANVLLSVLTEIHRFPSAKHLVSYLGLSPIITQSGTSVHGRTRISKMGDGFIRKSLYLPARTACLRSKLYKDWTQYHINRGKHPKQVYVMMMRKIVILAYNIVKENIAFDENKQNLIKNI